MGLQCESAAANCTDWSAGANKNGQAMSVFYLLVDRLRLKCDGTRAETRFRLSAKRTSPFKSVGGVSSVDYWQPRCAHQG